jgi:hypothetical protein
MTRDEIEKMTVVEVDCYIATKVMGWKAEAGDYKDQWFFYDPKGIGPVAPIYSDHGELLAGWGAATDLNQAIEAAEKVGLILDEDADDWYLTLHYVGGKPGMWRCGWVGSDWDKEEPVVKYSSDALTPALAVCRAVIAANEAERTAGEKEGRP